jgi:hypothetical protein
MLPCRPTPPPRYSASDGACSRSTRISTGATASNSVSAKRCASSIRCGRKHSSSTRPGPPRKTVKQTSKRTSGSPRRSRAPHPAKPSRAPSRLPPHRVPRESLDAIVAFARLAERENLRWYLFGAQAVATYGVPRTTGDVDITLDLGDRSLGLLVAPLRRAGFVPRISDESFAIETRIYPVTHKPTGWNFAELESMLDQRDLRPVYARLRAEQTSRKPGTQPTKRTRTRSEPTTARPRKSGR